ncbi:hypothetical protein FGG08_002732 [Glutinoglossum americanum]|uniref:A to I editase domain-containing protein n=1 Tax=Glutinoglossum americanum TaxID=1670608 RepID=A0A9P8I8L7_9PEZI|nr:hypothetical protein FGG08_002732 [Glutinoglossum americanum]
MATQEDPTPWSVTSGNLSSGETIESLLYGRGYFSELGAVRRKPARADAPSTLSKSCSDKLALKQCISVLSGLASLLISPQDAYIHSLILPASQHSTVACDRAFGPTGRMKAVAGRKWDGGYGFRPFSIKATDREFKYSRRSAMPNERLTTSNISVVWTPSIQETLIGGVLQGRKQFDPRGASQICRGQMWRMVVDILALCGLVGPERMTVGCRYGDAKEELGALKERRRVKGEVTTEALSGWTRNDGDDGFQLEDH